MVTYLEALNGLILTSLGFAIGMISSSLLKRGRQSKKNLFDSPSASTPEIDPQAEQSIASNTHLDQLRYILVHLAHDANQQIQPMSEAITRLENMHDLRTERASFLSKQLNLDVNSMEIFFSKYQLDGTLHQLEQAQSTLKNKMHQWTFPAKYRANQHISFKLDEFTSELIAKLQMTNAARALTALGLQPITLPNHPDKMRGTLNINVPTTNIIEKIATIFEHLCKPEMTQDKTSIDRFTPGLGIYVSETKLHISFNHSSNRGLFTPLRPAKTRQESMTQSKLIAGTTLALLQLKTEACMTFSTGQHTKQ